MDYTIYLKGNGIVEDKETEGQGNPPPVYEEYDFISKSIIEYKLVNVKVVGLTCDIESAEYEAV